MFFCLPILFGCQTQLKPEGDQSPRVCPRCHNAAVISAKSTTWFELFFIPLVPFSTKHIWLCGICQWKAPIQPGRWEPTVANNMGFPQINQGWHQAPNQPGYQPTYLNQTTPQK